MISFDVADCGGVGLRVRSGPSTSFPKTGVPNLKDGQSSTADEIVINDAGEKWLKLSSGGYCSADWVNITDSGLDSKSEVVEEPEPEINNPEPEPEKEEEKSSEVTSNGISDDMNNLMKKTKESLVNAIDGSVRLFGIPHQLLAHNDVRISAKSGLGRIFAETMVLEAPIVYIKPGTSKFLPGMSDSEREGLLSAFLSLGAGDSEKSDIINKAVNASEDTIKYFEFDDRFSDYMKRVNLLCRICAVFLGIDKEKFPWSKHIPIGLYDWRYYKFKSAYINSNPTLADGINEGQTGFGGLIERPTMAGIESAIMDDNEWIEFYVDASQPFSESASNSTTQSIIESSLEKLEGMAKELSMFSGLSGVDVAKFAGDTSASIDDVVQKMLHGDGAISTFFKRITGTTKQILSGGNIQIPEVYSDSNYSRSYTFNMTFSTPYNNVMSWYINVAVPLMHILGLAMPNHLSVNTYRSPYLLKTFCKGWFSSSLGIVKNLSIEKGGSGDAWSIGGLPAEIKVSLSVEDLYSHLALPAPYRPNDFLSDSGMCEFLMATCGCDITRQKFTDKFELVSKLFMGSLAESVSSTPYNIIMSFKNATRKLFAIDF